MTEKLKRLPEIVDTLNEKLTECHSTFIYSLYFNTKYSREGCTEDDYNYSLKETANLISNLNEIIEEIRGLDDEIQDHCDELIRLFGKSEVPEYESKFDMLWTCLDFIKDNSKQMLEMIDFYVFDKL